MTESPAVAADPGAEIGARIDAVEQLAEANGNGAYLFAPFVDVAPVQDGVMQYICINGPGGGTVCIDTTPPDEVPDCTEGRVFDTPLGLISIGAGSYDSTSMYWGFRESDTTASTQNYSITNYTHEGTVNGDLVSWDFPGSIHEAMYYYHGYWLRNPNDPTPKVHRISASNRRLSGNLQCTDR